MKLGLQLSYWGTAPEKGLELTLEAERLGFHSVWLAEAYGCDVFTPLAWLAAQTTTIRLATGIAQMPPRTPAMMAMTATTLDMLSNGRVFWVLAHLDLRSSKVGMAYPSANHLVELANM